MKTAHGPETGPVSRPRLPTTATPPPEPAVPAPAAAGAAPARRVRNWLKSALNGIGLAVVAPLALLVRLEGGCGGGQDLFRFFGQTLGLVPGRSGKLFRRCYYRLTLNRCSLDCDIGFLVMFSHRGAEVGRGVYVGPLACIGLVTLKDGALIGTRVSVISGSRQHEFGPDGKLTPTTEASRARVTIGSQTWIGEAAVVMADVGSQCIVAAGSVVSSRVADRSIVAGNPCRFVGRSVPDPPHASPDGSQS